MTNATSFILPALRDAARRMVGLPAAGAASCDTGCGAPSGSATPAASSSCCGTAAPTPLQREAARRAAPGAGATFTLRTAMPADLADVRELLAGAGLPSDDFTERFGEGYAVAVAHDGAIVGATGIEVYGAAGEPRHGLLRSAVVADAWRGRGVGEALTRDRLAWARAEGLATVYLLTTTAAAWFPRFGFEQVTRDSAPPALQESSEFAATCPSSAVTMRLALAR